MTKNIPLTNQGRHPVIRLKQVDKKYNKTAAVRNLDLVVPRGQILALLGPSGCGKTTTLRLVAGFEYPDSGTIELNGEQVSSPKRLVAPHKRAVSMVFQDLALWPHMTAAEHVAFALAPRLRKRNCRKKAVQDLLSRVRLKKAEHYPRQLSGGEQQRLALARALASEPEILLLDEPFSNLDLELKQELLLELKTLITASRITTLYVTHQLDEAYVLADQLVRMRAGSIEEMESPLQRNEQKIRHCNGGGTPPKARFCNNNNHINQKEQL